VNVLVDTSIWFLAIRRSGNLSPQGDSVNISGSCVDHESAILKIGEGDTPKASL